MGKLKGYLLHILKKLAISGMLILSGVLMLLWAYELNRADDYHELLTAHFNDEVSIVDCVSVDEPGQVRVCFVRVGKDDATKTGRIVKLDREHVIKSDSVTKDKFYSIVKE